MHIQRHVPSFNEPPSEYQIYIDWPYVFRLFLSACPFETLRAGGVNSDTVTKAHRQMSVVVAVAVSALLPA